MRPRSHHTELVRGTARRLTLRTWVNRARRSPIRRTGDAIVDLLGVLAYGELTAFSGWPRTPSWPRRSDAKAALARIAVAEFDHFELLGERLAQLGARSRGGDGSRSSPAIDAFHERTAPGTWLEGLVKAYVGDGIAADFYREISAFLDPETRDLVLGGARRTAARPSSWSARSGAAIEADQRLAGRLALWGAPAGGRGARARPSGWRPSGTR